MLRKYFLLLITLLTPYCLFAQEYVKIKRYGTADGLMESYVSCGLQDTYGYIWFCTRDGLVQYDGYHFKTYKAWPGDNCPLETNRIDFIKELPNHDILCYSNKKYYRFHRDSQQFELLNDTMKHKAEELPHAEEYKRKIQQLGEYKDVNLKVRLIDRQGGIWIRSFRGLERVEFVQAPIRNRKLNPEEGDEYIRMIHLDNRQRIWIADKNGYVQILDKDANVIGYLNAQGQITTGKSCFGHLVYSMLEDSKGNIWLGTKPDGLFLLTPRGNGYELRQFLNDDSQRQTISCPNIYEILEDQKHRYWVGTYGGGLNLMRVLPDGTVTFVNEKNIKSNYPHDRCQEIHCMKIVRGDILLIGTNGGLVTCRLYDDPAKIRFYLNRRDPADAASLSNNQVMGIAEDAHGDIFLATNGGGINKILSKDLLSDHLVFEPYTSRNGLAADACKNLFFDTKGTLWIVSEMALTNMDTATGTFTNYQNGLFRGDFQFEETKPLCLSDGRMLFPTTQGFLMFGPKDIEKKHFIPDIRFTCPDTLLITYDKRTFSLEFAALDYSKNEEIVYAYRIEGLDNEWHYTKDNQVHFTNLPPGRYTLHIKSTNGDGVWVDNEHTIFIHRKAKFNETRYAWMLYGILLLFFLLLIYTIVKYIRQLKKEMADYKLATGEQLEYMRSRIKELIQQDQQVAQPLPDDTSKQPDDLFAQEAKAFMQENMRNFDLVVDDFAHAMHMSNSLLYLKCKKSFGMSPNKFIMQERLRHAVELLDRQTYNVTEVAYQCGFSDPKYFSKFFKKAMGMAPSEYSKKN